jgi:hypothetical protein
MEGLFSTSDARRGEVVADRQPLLAGNTFYLLKVLRATLGMRSKWTSLIQFNQTKR